MSAVKRDENSTTALVVQNTLGTSVLFPTGAAYGSVTAQHVALVDATGNQLGTVSNPINAILATESIEIGKVDQGTANTQANAWPVEISDTTNAANILKSDGTAAGQNAQLFAPTYLEKTSLSAGSNNADLVPSVDVSNYKRGSIQVIGTWSGTLSVQGSNDNSNWVTINVLNLEQSNITNGISGNDIWVFQIQFRYLRIRMTSYSSGTANGTLELYTTPHTFVPEQPTGFGFDGNFINSPQFQAGIYASGGSNSWDMLRTPKIFHSAQATSSGDTAAWTPNSGKKFRLMKFKVQVTGNAVISGGGVLTLKLRDSTTDLNLTHDVYVPAAAATAVVSDYDSGWLNLGNGVLSASANNVLNVNLSAAVTTGNVRVIVCGTEE